ncbi:hypothetical protein [Delftia tsuruhatensis]|uniref:hypothetical protein n=1 Tax=Delftia tsuruhatensis TaxID=180282 RepID=UPI0023DA8316|nr:hypothetical protein [Delftia tsuruhatensis]WEM01133.1 hypothetical protein PW274_12870 [Delftia tsuruhatensis]
MKHIPNNQRRVPDVVPKFWRPKLAPTTKLSAKVAHHDLVQRLETGTATVADLWDWIETGFTYSQMFRLLWEDGEPLTEEAEHAIAAQLNTYPAVCQRLREKKRVGLSGPELQIARQAAQVFDGLIDLDRNGIAVAAVQWSEKQMAQIRGALHMP